MANILVVDDNATYRQVVAAVLGHEGHLVLEAADGAEALELARKERPDLVISDVVMPSMDGYELVRRLRADPQLAATAVIFHTAHFGDQDAHELAQRCQVSHMLAKPCDKSSLLRVIAQALGTEAPVKAQDLPKEFDRDHRRLITNKLAQKIEELQREIEERKQGEARIRHLNRVYAVLSGINSLIVRVATRDELCKGACRLAVVQGHFRMAWIGMVDQAAGLVVPFAWSGEAADLQQAMRVSATGSPEADGLIGTAVLSRLPQLCNDLRSPSATVVYREELLARGYRSILALPLVVDDRAAGCLLLVSEEADFFDAAEMRLLAELAGDISYALDHIEKAERLNYLAYYDSLTGLANRTLFHERLTQRTAAAQQCDVARSGPGVMPGSRVMPQIRAPVQTGKAPGAIKSRAEEGAEGGRGQRAICTKISLGLTMPSSWRAFSSTISRPSCRSLTSAASRVVAACGLGVSARACSVSRRCISLTLGRLPRPNHSCACTMTQQRNQEGGDDAVCPRSARSRGSAQVVEGGAAGVGGDVAQVFFDAQQLVVLGHAVRAATASRS